MSTSFDCTLGYDGTHCQKDLIREDHERDYFTPEKVCKGYECGNYCLNLVTEAIEIPQFMGRSYLTYDSPDILKRLSGSRMSVFLRFKSFSKDGLLLWRGENLGQAHTDYLSIGLQNGALVYRDGQSGKLTVDDYGSETGRSPGQMRQLNLSGELYIVEDNTPGPSSPGARGLQNMNGSSSSTSPFIVPVGT
ncbi:hypothetical protein QTP86_033701 [Hemibagrus guttatus]|nr:hypothetical protein QTP86_033701 [Hemibagrus guttatus]